MADLFTALTGKATDREINGAEDPYEKPKASIERRITRAMLAYFIGLQQRAMRTVRRQKKEMNGQRQTSISDSS